MAFDHFGDFRRPHLGGPFREAHPVTPSDSEDLPFISNALWVGKGGRLSVIMADGQSPVQFQKVPDGTMLHVRVRRVMATGTDADKPGQVVSLL